MFDFATYTNLAVAGIENVWYTKTDAVVTGAGTMLGNACLTRATGLGANALDAKFVYGIGGGFALVPTCPQLAADGYTNTGMVLLSRGSSVPALSDTTRSPFAAKNIINFTKLKALTGFSGTSGQYGSAGTKVINQGSVVSVVVPGDATN